MRGCLGPSPRGPNCWRLELPADWATYEASLSKSHRKQVRRLIDRVFDTGRARLHTVADQSQLERGRQILIDLHQRRRVALGEPGCFSSSAFANFHEDAMPRLLAAGLLRLHWLELDGVPAAAEYHLSDGGVIYGYQSGVAPELIGRAARAAVGHRHAAAGRSNKDSPRSISCAAMSRTKLISAPAASRWSSTGSSAPRATARLRHQAWSVREEHERLVAGQAAKTASGRASMAALLTTDATHY